MTLFPQLPNHASRRLVANEEGEFQQVFDALLNRPYAPESREAGYALLERKLAEAAALPANLPAEPSDLHAWMNAGVASATEQYSAYLKGRKEGGQRRYFRNRAHALYFIQGVAPTKLVDGAWLYGLLAQWNDRRLYPLIRTYLEELGEGVESQNHVAIYRQLLDQHGCDQWQQLPDEHFEQGALQLALAYHAEQFLPELIGYNLGYEQLPLHLLICNFELNELGIDPYYFKLHVTIDNASTGHAQQAVQAVLQSLPVVGDSAAFYQRVLNGYRLNDLGLSSTGVIAGFDIDRELLAMLERKRSVAGQVHSDYCRIGGRTVNEWLSAPGQVGGFFDALQERGWIRRGQAPSNSRFWLLIEGEQASMFGVFSAYEKQLLHDWIADGWVPAGDTPLAGGSVNDLTPIFRDRFRSGITPGNADIPDSDFDQELTDLRKELEGLNRAQRMGRLIELMSPALHATAPGLLATRLFSQWLG